MQKKKKADNSEKPRKRCLSSTSGRKFLADAIKLKMPKEKITYIKQEDNRRGIENPNFLKNVDLG